MARLRNAAFLFCWFALQPLLYGAGSWNGISPTAVDGVAFTAWNGTGVSFGGSSFTYYSAVFNGSDSVTRGADLTGDADSALGLISFWIKVAAGSEGQDNYLWLTDGSEVQVILKDTGILEIEAKNSGGTDVLDVFSTTAITSASGWVHVIASWDLGTSGRVKIYRNGSNDTGTIATFTVGGTIDYTQTNWRMSYGFFTVDYKLSEFYWAHPAAYFDLTNGTNLAKFISGGHPVNLGSDGSTPTGTAPLVYLHNQVGGSPEFLTNKGTGGNFTMDAGALADGGADIP